jgi:hypothetical protein
VQVAAQGLDSAIDQAGRGGDGPAHVLGDVGHPAGDAADLPPFGT